MSFWATTAAHVSSTRRNLFKILHHTFLSWISRLGQQIKWNFIASIPQQPSSAKESEWLKKKIPSRGTSIDIYRDRPNDDSSSSILYSSWSSSYVCKHLLRCLVYRARWPEYGAMVCGCRSSVVGEKLCYSPQEWKRWIRPETGITFLLQGLCGTPRDRWGD